LIYFDVSLTGSKDSLIDNAIADLLERAAIVRGRFHRADLYHRLLVAEFAAYWAPTQKSDLVRFHC
jgi:hypothetical protein